jgi:hypothetical protein
MIAAISARILLALCCLLILATSASAECAWVLWSEISDYRANGREPIKTLAPIIALDTRAECDAALTQSWQDAVKVNSATAGSRVASRRGLVEVFRQGEKGEFLGKTTYFWQCLPDTVDPRGPKGK